MFFLKSVLLYVSKTGYSKVLLFSSHSNSVLHQTLDYHGTFSKFTKLKDTTHQEVGSGKVCRNHSLNIGGCLFRNFSLKTRLFILQNKQVGQMDAKNKVCKTVWLCSVLILFFYEP